MAIITWTGVKAWFRRNRAMLAIVLLVSGLVAWAPWKNASVDKPVASPPPVVKKTPKPATTRPAVEDTRRIAKGAGFSMAPCDGESAAARAVANAFAQANSGSAIVDVHTESGPSVELKRVGEIVGTVVGSDKLSDFQIERKKDGVFTITVTPKTKPKTKVRIFGVEVADGKATIKEVEDPNSPSD